MGVLSYLLDHDDAEYISGTVTPGTARQMTGEFVAISGIRPDIGKPVWHNSLRLPAGEHLQAGQWAEIARDYMREMGYLDTSQWVAIRHNNPQGEHIHIVANRVLLDGSIYYGRDDNLQSTRVIAQLEKKHGLTVTHEPDIDVNGDLLLPSRAKMKKGEIEKALRTGNAPTRIMLQLIIDEALDDKPILWDFVERLHSAGVNVRSNIATTGRVNGLAFELHGLSFGGSKLGKKYAWTNLKKSIDYQSERDNQLLQQLKNWAVKNDEITANRSAGRLSESSTSTPSPDYKRVGPSDEQDHSFTAGVRSAAQKFSKDYQSFQQPNNQVFEQSGESEQEKNHAGVEVGQNQYLLTNHRTNNNNTAVGIAADNPSHKGEINKMSDNNINDLKAALARKKHDADAETELALKKEQRVRQAKKRQVYLTMESIKPNAVVVTPETNNRFLKLIELAFDKKGNNYFKKSTGELAFYETDDKIICSHTNPDQTTIKAMQQAARAKFGDEWRSFGPQAYIREAWFQAAMMGCNTVGHKPSTEDWEELKKRTADYEQKYGHKPPQFHQKILDGLNDHEIGLEILALPDLEDSESDTGSLDSQNNNKPEPEFSFANRLNTWRDKQKRKKGVNENNSNFPKPSPWH